MPKNTVNAQADIFKPIKIAVISKSDYFREYTSALVRSFRSLGAEAETFEFMNHDYKPDGFLVIHPGMFRKEKFYHKEFAYGAVQTEQISSPEVGAKEYALPRYQIMLKEYRRYDFIFEWSRASWQTIKKRKDNIYFIPHGGLEEYEYFRQYPNEKEQFDLLFLGDITGFRNRRTGILEHLDKKYKLYPYTKPIWGEEKKKAILGSKICLNIHYQESQVFESPRIYEYLCNRRFVLSEPIYDPYPFEDGTDLVSFLPFNLTNLIDKYLNDAPKRLAIAESGYQKTRTHSADRYARTIVQRFQLEKSMRARLRYRVRDRLFHLTGSDLMKDISRF